MGERGEVRVETGGSIPGRRCKCVHRGTRAHFRSLMACAYVPTGQKRGEETGWGFGPWNAQLSSSLCTLCLSRNRVVNSRGAAAANSDITAAFARKWGSEELTG